MFGGLGEMAGLMKKFGEIQKNMKAMKEEMASLEIVGKDATGKVVVELSGDLQVKGFHIAPELMVSGQNTVLEAACSAALADALQQFRSESAKRLSEATGGLNIPGLT